MIIHNDFMPRYNPVLQRTKNNAGAGVQPDFQKNYDNYNNSFRESGRNLDPMANAPQNVKDAWEKAEREMGKEESGDTAGVPISHISGYMITKLEQRFQTGSGDVFGSSVDSALAGAQKILNRLNNPLSPPSSPEVAALQEKEKLFYQKFMDNLANIEDSPKKHEVSPAALYEQMTGRATASKANCL